MTNTELQSIIKEGDMCYTDGIYCKFVGYAKCKWRRSGLGFDYGSCSTCKGRMIFEKDGKTDTRCHSHGGTTRKSYSDVEILFKLGQVLPKELFEI